LDSAEDIACSTDLVAAEIRAKTPEEADVVVPDCVLDPAVGPAHDAAGPVGGSTVMTAGILALAGHHLAALGPFAAVCRNPAIAAELHRRADEQGLGSALVTVEVMDADFCLITDEDAWAEALLPVARRVRELGVSRLFNGCSAVDIPDPVVAGVTVVDPVALALRCLEVSVASGLLGAPSSGEG
jgi:hypothetical protein